MATTQGTPRTSAQTTTDLTDTVLNPVRTNKQRTIVSLTLVYDNLNFDPAALRTALATIGTVASEKNQPSRGSFIFNISP